MLWQCNERYKLWFIHLLSAWNCPFLSSRITVLVFMFIFGQLSVYPHKTCVWDELRSLVPSNQLDKWITHANRILDFPLPPIVWKQEEKKSYTISFLLTTVQSLAVDSRLCNGVCTLQKSSVWRVRRESAKDFFPPLRCTPFAAQASAARHLPLCLHPRARQL